MADTKIASTQFHLLQQFINLPGGKPPLLVYGAPITIIKSTIDNLLAWTIAQNLTSVADITLCQTKQATISIKQIRTLLANAIYKPISARRIIVIHDCNKLSLPAANSLLKFLEESNPAVRVILTSTHKRNLLPTILSRCQFLSVTARLSVKNNLSNTGLLNTQSLLTSISQLDKITDRQIEALCDQISEQLRINGPSPELKQTVLRLRDYFKIKHLKGNKKLALEILLSHLPHHKDYSPNT